MAQDGLPSQIVRVSSRREFLAALEARTFDIILSDYSGPSFDGQTALADAQRLSPSTPFIMLTGTLGEETAVEILKKGATDFVLKGRLERLPQAIRRALREAQHRESRERAELALRGSERILRQVIDLVPHFIFAKDADGRFLLVNRALAEAYGTAVDDLLGKTDADFARSPEEARHFREDDLKVIRSGQPKLIPYETITNQDGTVRILETLKIPFFPEDQDKPAVLGIAIDITEQRRSQEQLREQVALLQMAPDAIIVRDEADRIRFWNEAAERIYGWPALEVLGRRASDVLRVDGEKLAEARQALLEGEEWSGELQKTRRDGQAVTVQSRWARLRDVAGQPKGTLTIDTDVTERKALEAQLLRAQRLESIGTLAGGIAHDLNNVLAPILMSVEMIGRRTDDDRILKLLTGIESSVRRGSNLVKQVLTFARGVGGERVALRIEDILTEIEGIIRQTFPKRVELRVKTAGSLRLVSADATQLHQVLLNLCVNARDAMPDGGVLELMAANVDVDASYARTHAEAAPGPYVVIRVRDTGSGIPRAVLERIFEPFFTTKEVGKGTGLGLSTVLGIVRSHGGFITVYSEVNRGTTFHVHLPAAVGTRDAEVTASAPQPPLGRGELVLLVDDEAALREISKETLESYGYKVLTAADGAEAVAVFSERSQEVGAVVTDVNMPIMDGPMTVRALRRIHANVPIVVASGRELHLPNDPAFSGIGVLPKPYTAVELLEALARVLSRKDPIVS